MLVLSRKAGEQIVIGDQVSVMVIEVRGNCVRLGVEAPSDVKIHRKEVWLEIQSEKDSANDK